MLIAILASIDFYKLFISSLIPPRYTYLNHTYRHLSNMAVCSSKDAYWKAALFQNINKDNM